MLDQLQKDLASIKAQGTSIAQITSEQSKLIKDYANVLKLHGASKKLIDSLQTEQNKLETEVKSLTTT